jgi:hypothetical protein
MSTTDAKPVSHLLCTPYGQPCQETKDRPAFLLPNRILLLNFPPLYGEQLALSLLSQHRRSTPLSSHTLPTGALTHERLQAIDFVLVDLTSIDHDFWELLRRICRTTKRDGTPLFVQGWSRRDLHPVLQNKVEDMGIRILNSPEPRTLVHALDSLKARRAKLSMLGPHCRLTHRFWQPETICTPGEAIANIEFLHYSRAYSLRVSTCLMLLFDYMARKRHTSESVSLIAAGLGVDPFTQEHGQHANAHKAFGKHFSRTGVKQQIKRLRDAMGKTFDEAGLNLDPERVLVSEATETNEVRYRLKISVEWQHLEF